MSRMIQDSADGQNFSNSLSIEDLIKEVQNGNQNAFEKLYYALVDRLFAYAYSHLKDRDKSLDCLQDTFFDLWCGLRSFKYRSDEEFYGYCFLILKRRISKVYGRDKRSYLHNTFGYRRVEEEIDIRHTSFDVNDDFRFLHAYISLLPKRYQEVLRLRYWADLAFSEIALCMRTNVSTAKVWHHRAIKKLQSKLIEKQYDKV